MVVSTNQNTVKTGFNQGNNEKADSPNKINGSTRYDLCTERLSPFGGLLALIKFLDLIDFEKRFYEHFKRPNRPVYLGYFKMVLGLLALLFIGFQRVGHVGYIRYEPMVCGMLEVGVLPAISTFWRFVQSLGINQSRSLLSVMGAVRREVWKLCRLRYRRITVNIDTTVSTVYGAIQGARKGHNTKYRGKKGLRPVLAFIEQTREYLIGFQRRGTTISGREVARLIRDMGSYLPESVSEVLIRGDGEFISWESVCACVEQNYRFIFGVKNFKPPFFTKGWYRHGEYEYNEIEYTPTGWKRVCRFVAMRIPKEKLGERQLAVFEEDNYVYRIFVTDLGFPPHIVIRNYDKRADTENLVKEAQHEGILAIPSRKFQSNHAFFQIVMLAYNLWRWMKLVAGYRYEVSEAEEVSDHAQRAEAVDATIRISRLKMLFIAAKIVTHSDETKVRYSMHDARAAEIIDFLEYLDRKRKQKKESPEQASLSYYLKAS